MGAAAFNDVLGVIVAIAGVLGAAYAFLRFLVKPMVQTEVEAAKEWYVKYDEKEHTRLENKIDSNRSERLAQIGELKDDLKYIRGRIDQVFDKITE